MIYKGVCWKLTRQGEGTKSGVSVVVPSLVFFPYLGSLELELVSDARLLWGFFVAQKKGSTMF